MLFYSSKIFVTLSLSSLILARGAVGSVNAIQSVPQKKNTVAATASAVISAEPKVSATTTQKKAKTESINTDTVTLMATPTPEATTEPTQNVAQQHTSQANTTANNASTANNNPASYNPPAPDNSGYQEVDNGEEDTGYENNSTQYVSTPEQSESFADFNACQARATSLAASGHTNSGCYYANGNYTVTWK